ncbi:MAG: hypothetical protein ACPHXR_07255 [Flavicella sp.]
MKNKNLNRMLCLASLVCITSCDTSYFDKEMEGSQINLELPVPIGTSEYSMDRMFEELEFEDIQTQDDGTLAIRYTESLQGGDNAAFDVEISDINVSSTVPLSGGLAALPSGVPYPGPDNVFPGNHQELKVVNLTQRITSAILDRGNLEIILASSYESEIELTISIPSLLNKDSGLPFSRTESLTNETKTLDLVNLQEYKADFSYDGAEYNKTYNLFVVDIDYDFKIKTGDVVSATSALNFEVNVTDSKSPEAVFGDFLDENFDISNQTISLDFFEDFGDGNISFANATMTLEASSGYGFPVGLNLSGVTATNFNDGASVSLEKNDGSDFEAIFDGVAVVDYDPNGSTKETILVLDKDNSNINELLNSKPNEINLNLSGSANPNHSDVTPNSNFFAKGNDGFGIDLVIDVPLDIKFENLEQTETFEFDVDEISEELESLTLKIATENEIPLTGKINLIFKRANGTIVNDILTQTDIVAFKAAPVDDSGKSIGVESTSTEINITNVEALNEVDEIDLVITLDSTEGAESVVLNKNNSVKATLSAKASATVNLDDSDNE